MGLVVLVRRQMPALRASDRSRRTAHYSRTRSNVARDNCASADDGAISNSHSGQDDRAAAYPHVIADRDRQRALQAAAALLQSMGVVCTIDLHHGSQHCVSSNPDRCGIDDDAVGIYERTIGQCEVPAIRDVKRGLDQHRVTNGGEKRCKLRSTSTAQFRVHCGVSPTCMARDIAQCLELGRDTLIPASICDVCQFSRRRVGDRNVCRHLRLSLTLKLTQDSQFRPGHGYTISTGT